MSLYPEDAARVAELTALHHSDPEIAEMFETNARAVYSFRKRHGISAGRKGGAQPGKHHKGWKGGRIVDKSGYVLIHRPQHPHANVNGYVREHRLVMEAHLGRLLDPHEVVHHKPGCEKSDNQIENLTLYSKNSDHLRDELTGKTPNWTEEGKEAMRQNGRNRKGRKGRTLTPEQCQAISDRLKGRVFSPEARANMSAAQKAKAPASAETRAKLSAALSSRPRTPEWREKMSVALTGRVMTPEWRAKLSAAAKARPKRKAENQAQESQVPDTRS